MLGYQHITQVRSGAPSDIRKFDEVIESAGAFLQWTRDMGAEVPEDNWIVRTIKKYKKVEQAPSKEKQRAYSMHFPNSGELQYNLVDFRALEDIQENIGQQDATILLPKLNQLLRGPDSLLTELKHKRDNRNTRFELALTAKLNRSGFQAALCDPNPDIAARRNKNRIAIECKRPLGIKNLLPVLIEANNQLKSLVQPEKYLGTVAAIDVTRLFTEGKYHLTGDPEVALDHVVDGIDALLEPILEECRKGKLASTDIIMFYYLDHVQPDPSDPLELHKLSQLTIANNPRLIRRKKRALMRVLRKISL